MSELVELFVQGYSGYANYLWHEITQPHLKNFFYLLIFISGFVWMMEIIFPWRKNQSVFRKDFFLDGFYMFFNFFLFSLLGFNSLSLIGSSLFNTVLTFLGIEHLAVISLHSFNPYLQLVILFVLADFIQWNIHRLLHKVPWLWKFHKVHHSVTEMGFAAHLRYHWMESVVYKSLQYIPLGLLGFSVTDFFIVYVIQIIIGHLNHANINLTYGSLKYILNNPVMHIWHHAKKLPEGSYGVNFGISLSLWDYLFKTSYIPSDGKDIELGFPSIETYPGGFITQMKQPFNE